jgi:hypothetical protein
MRYVSPLAILINFIVYAKFGVIGLAFVSSKDTPLTSIPIPSVIINASVF